MRTIRILDVVGSLVGLVLLAPIMLVSALAVRLESTGPVLFVQKRVGKDNALFYIYKFRTMYVGTPEVAKGDLASTIHTRVTRVGRFLRRTSIDELPQLFNVLKGDMSLVGPRPALHNQADLIGLRTAVGVHRMYPGLTGLAQVMGREDMALETKVQLDQRLQHDYGLSTYIRLIFRTFLVLFSKRGTY